MISLCMIVKDEEDVLDRCLCSVKEKLKDVVDEIIVVDTGSMDNTINIAKKHNCLIYNFEWCDDFSKARNYGIDRAKNDWVLVLDADEYVETVSIKELINLQCGEYDNVRCNIRINNLSDENNLIDTTKVPRVFNRKYFTYMYSIHEQVSVKPDVVDAKEYVLKMWVNHTGYSQSTIINKDKNNRYKKLLKDFLNENQGDPYMDAYMNGQLGTVYFREENFKEAIKYYKVAVFSNQNLNIDALTKCTIEYIQCLIEVEDYDNALLCEQLWEKCSHNDKYLNWMAKVYILSSDTQKAIETFLLLINRNDTCTLEVKEAYYMLGQILELCNEYEQAVVCYGQAGEYKDSVERLENLKI